jgi:hypothetical protein
MRLADDGALATRCCYARAPRWSSCGRMRLKVPSGSIASSLTRRAAAALGLQCLEPRVRLLHAGVAVQRGDTTTALTLLTAVLTDPADVPDRELVRAAAALRKGELLGGVDGEALVAHADAGLRALGVANPKLFARLV